MAYHPSYAEGGPVREGDWVRMGKSTDLGRVSEVISTQELAEERKQQGPGVVVDAPPSGFVFLSEAHLLEEPLQFVRRGPSENLRFPLALSLGIGALLLLPALYSLGSAFHSAIATGHVLVISLGRYETARELVPWQEGWARFVGPILLLGSLLAFDSSRGVTFRWWFAGTGSICALGLLSFSLWFTSWAHSLWFAGLLAFVVSVSVINRRLGGVTAFLFTVACTSFVVWRVARAI